MSSLSLNWKRLNLKIKKDHGASPAASQIRHKGRSFDSSKLKGKVVKERKNTNIPKTKLTKDAISKATHSTAGAQVQASATPETPIPVVSRIAVSPMEYVLWTFGEDLKLTHLAKAKESPSLTKIHDLRKQETGKYIAMDCEFVGVGEEGKESALARASLVNYHGHTIYDKYVKPEEPVTDWRTWVSGIAPHHMRDAVLFKQAQDEIAQILDGRILVGHSIKNDLDALLLSHPKMSIRDTSRYPPFRELSKGRSPALKKLAAEVLNIEIQGASHSSVEDSIATMLLFRLHRRDFEKRLGVVNRRPAASSRITDQYQTHA